jgi:hypothetical protein
MNLAEIKKELVEIDKATSSKTLQGCKQYVGRFINKYRETYGEPHKFDMSDEAAVYVYAIQVYKGLHI